MTRNECLINQHHKNEKAMSWSKVKAGKKPFMWWFNKILCEFYWHIGNTRQYYKYLNRLLSYGFNLYGDKI